MRSRPSVYALNARQKSVGIVGIAESESGAGHSSGGGRSGGDSTSESAGGRGGGGVTMRRGKSSVSMEVAKEQGGEFQSEISPQMRRAGGSPTKSRGPRWRCIAVAAGEARCSSGCRAGSRERSSFLHSLLPFAQALAVALPLPPPPSFSLVLSPSR
eukprot:5944377-Pleurochrysis_carterae.AAC.1